VNGGDEGEGIFIYIHEIDNETSCNCFQWAGEGIVGGNGGDV
jgi:hypothetical protein